MSVLTQNIERITHSPFDVEWPTHADLMITRLPSAVKGKLSDERIEELAKKAYAALNFNSLVFISVASLKEDKHRPTRVAEVFQRAGFDFVDKIVWVRDRFIPVQGDKRLNNTYEEVLMLSKGQDYHLNRKALAYSTMTPDAIQSVEDTAKEENGQDISICLGNVWHCATDDKDTLSTDLLTKCIVLCDLLPNSLILDPFAFPGPSVEVVERMGHSFWGCGFKRAKKAKGSK